MKPSKPPHDADTPVVHPGYVRILCAMVARAGGDVDLVLARAGIDPDALHDDGPMLPMSLMRWLVHAAEQVSGNPALALDAGSSVRLASHGVVGEALQACADLRQALDLLPRFLGVRTSIARARVEPEPGGLVYRIEPLVNLGDARRFVLEHIAASASRLCREVSGGPLTGATIDLPWPRPPWHARVERYVPPPRYDAAGLALHLPDAVLDRPNPQADPARCADAVRRCEAALVAARPSFRRRVQRLVEDGQGAGWTLAAVARQLGLSSRTVIRRLRDEGTDFGTVVEAVRRERARALLVHTTLPVAEVALALGFRSGSNFSRSVRRWYGLTPAALRTGHAPGAADA